MRYFGRFIHPSSRGLLCSAVSSPRDEHFFGSFNELAEHIAAASRRLAELFDDPGPCGQKHVRAIKEIEHQADELTHAVNQRLDKSFYHAL